MEHKSEIFARLVCTDMYLHKNSTPVIYQYFVTQMIVLKFCNTQKSVGLTGNDRNEKNMKNILNGQFEELAVFKSDNKT